MSPNTIKKRIELAAPVSRVWRALTDPVEFGQWFGVKIRGRFVAGKKTRGRITHPGYEHIKFELAVVSMEPEKLFSYSWHPYAADSSVDYSRETPTLVVFRLRKSKLGTLLTVTESGFGKIPAGRRPEAFRMNSWGWAAQMKNIKRHVAKK